MNESSTQQRRGAPQSQSSTSPQHTFKTPFTPITDGSNGFTTPVQSPHQIEIQRSCIRSAQKVLSTIPDPEAQSALRTFLAFDPTARKLDFDREHENYKAKPSDQSVTLTRESLQALKEWKEFAIKWAVDYSIAGIEEAIEGVEKILGVTNSSDDYAQRLESVSPKIKQLSEDARQLEENLKQYHELNKSLSSQIDELGTALEKSNEKNEELESENAALTKEVAKLKKLNDKLISIIQKLEGSNKTLEDANRALSSTLSETEAKLTEAAAKLAKGETYYTDLIIAARERVEELGKQNKTLQEENVALKAKAEQEKNKAATDTQRQNAASLYSGNQLLLAGATAAASTAAIAAIAITLYVNPAIMQFVYHMAHDAATSLLPGIIA